MSSQVRNTVSAHSGLPNLAMENIKFYLSTWGISLKQMQKLPYSKTKLSNCVSEKKGKQEQNIFNTWECRNGKIEHGQSLELPSGWKWVYAFLYFVQEPQTHFQNPH